MVKNVFKRAMFRSLIISLFLAIVLYPIDSPAWSLFGPNNYEDCILDKMEGVSSNRAAIEISKACRKKFPTEKQKTISKSRPLSRSNIALLKQLDRRLINVGITHYDYYLALNLYNGNKNITITGLDIRVKFSWTTRDYIISHSHENGIPIGQPIFIRPNRAQDIHFSLNQRNNNFGKILSVQIVGATGAEP